jgi:hypothetical protein
MRNLRWTIIGLAIAGTIVLAACGGSPTPSSGAAKAIEDYLHALVARDVNSMIDVACLEWEQQARVEYDAFSAVKLDLKDLSCRETGKDTRFTLVTCSGTIVANYGAEDMNIDLAERTYQVVDENGLWRMCGYR